MGFCGFLGVKRGFFVFWGEFRLRFFDFKSIEAGFVGFDGRQTVRMNRTAN